jgi:hypothetical protein
MTAHDFDEALDVLEEAGFSEVHVFENRRPVALAIADVRESLQLACME